jgi:putative transposase
MSYVRIWIHMVFSTKNREPWLTEEIRYRVQKHIMKNCSEKRIYLRIINGYTNHLHCLISLGKEQSVSKVAQLIKGESSNWINNNNLISDKFYWQDDYFAVSVSESQVDNIIKYIENQEAHHSKITFEEEAAEFMRKYKWKINFK